MDNLIHFWRGKSSLDSGKNHVQLDNSIYRQMESSFPDSDQNDGIVPVIQQHPFLEVKQSPPDSGKESSPSWTVASCLWRGNIYPDSGKNDEIVPVE